MSNDIVLKSGWVKIDKSELDTLRADMRIRYEKDGGSKKFNSHLPNYNELREMIAVYLTDFQERSGTQIKIEGQYLYEIVPGNTFFKDLFYTKKDVGNPQFQEYNIEICYLYVYAKTRFAKKMEDRRQAEISVSSFPRQKNQKKIIISSTINNMTEAEKIREHLKELFNYKVETETRNAQIYSKGSLEEFYNNLDDNTYVFTLISRDYLQNENCVKELIHYLKNNLDNYLKHTIHILHKDIYQGDFNIFDSLGRSELLKYWKLRIEKLEENHKLLISGKKELGFYKKLSEELKEIKEIIEELHGVLDLIRENRCSILFEIFINKIKKQEDIKRILPTSEKIIKIDSELETTYKRIKIPSNNDPDNPEFPPEPFYNPKFPASETFRIEIPGFSNVWLKDESTNPTGTHKDRLAWEVVIKYKSMIEALKYKNVDTLPQMSIISSGSAAIAIQHLFNIFKIPTKLKVLVDNNLNESIKNDIKQIGCELYSCDLSERLLSSDDIKKLTDNESGIDITYREVLDPTHDTYYDWLSYEIINEKPEYCLVPFGTGDLYINVLNIVKIEYFYSFVSKHDPRFRSDIETLIKCHYLGASSRKSDTKLDKLFSNFLPSIESFKTYIDQLKQDYNCVGSLTDIYYVDEQFVDEAIKIAEDQKITFEPSGIAGLALLLQQKNNIPSDSKILIVNTGKTKQLKQLLAL